MVDHQMFTVLGTAIALVISVAVCYWTAPRKGVHETGIEPHHQTPESPKPLNKVTSKRAS